MMKYSIETSNLVKKYADHIVVNNINLKVKKGEIFGFLGKNGAGKSTFINMITGITLPTAGEFAIHHNKRKVGVLPDYSSFYDDLTALDHLIYFSKILGANKSGSELKELLDRVGLENVDNRKLKNYSFGMKKKLGIAQTLINDPEIIFLDEPTSGVDVNSILTIHKLIKDISKRGTTVFLTSHNLDEVERLCDSVAIMDKGKIRVHGGVDEIKQQFMDHTMIYIKTKNMNEDQLIQFNQKAKSLVLSSECKENLLTITLNDQEHIPLINELCVSLGIKIYELRVHEARLEEVFLKTGTDDIKENSATLA